MSKTHPPVVPPYNTRYFPKGSTCKDSEAGDLLIVNTPGFIAGGIKWAERLRRPAGWVSKKEWRLFCEASHCAVIIEGGPAAVVSQEMWAGDRFTQLSSAAWLSYAVVHIDCAPEQRADAISFAQWSQGTGYGLLSIPADFLNALLGLEMAVGWGNRMTCSTMTCFTALKMGLIPDRLAPAVSPAHMAWYFNVNQLGG